MGTVLEFPANLATRPQSPGEAARPAGDRAMILILPVIRVERHATASSESDGPGVGDASGGGRRRRRRG